MTVAGAKQAAENKATHVRPKVAFDRVQMTDAITGALRAMGAKRHKSNPTPSGPVRRRPSARQERRAMGNTNQRASVRLVSLIDASRKPVRIEMTPSVRAPKWKPRSKP